MADKNESEETLIPVDTLSRFVKAVLLKAGVRRDVAVYVAEGLLQSSIRGVDSHGVRLLPHYVKGVKGGRINPDPHYGFVETSPSTGRFDADNTFGHAACMEAAHKAIELAKKAGSGHIAVYNSSHFGAAAYYVLEIARHDMIGMAFTNTDALVKSYAGRRSFFGNNPIAFAAPCEDEEPFCLDMATSVVTFNKIRQLREQGIAAPEGAGADKDGIDTTDPNDISMLLPIGGHKGYGLSAMVEILCSVLTGMQYGPHIPKMFEAPMSQQRNLGQFISAMRVDCFQDKDVFKKRLSVMMNELRREPSLDEKMPVQVAGDPEKKIAEKRKRTGIPLKTAEYDALRSLGLEFSMDLK